MNVPFLVSNILSGVGMCAMLASTALRSRRKILAVQSVNHALSMAACSLLRGWSGAVQEAVNLVRDLAVLLFGKLNRFWQIFFVAAALGLGAAVTFAGGFQWYGLLPVLATALYSAVVVHPRCNARWIKASTAVCTMMWGLQPLYPQLRLRSDERHHLGLRRPFPAAEPKARRNNRMKVRVRRVSAEDVPVAITTEFIKLESFLKLANAVPSGGMAKNFIQNCEVLVNGEPCTMRGKKLRPGDDVRFDGVTYCVRAAHAD